MELEPIEQRNLTVLLSAIHVHLESQVTSHQKISLDIEICPISILSVSKRQDIKEVSHQL